MRPASRHHRGKEFTPPASSTTATLWLGVLGAVAFAEQAIETITIFGSTGFTEPGGTMNLQLGAGLTAAWMLAFAVWGGVRGRNQNVVA